jgi:hypothetical protein
MFRGLLIIGGLLGTVSLSQAQFAPNPGFGGGFPNNNNFVPNNFMPNFFNRQSQPLSPYLNLLGGGNPGVNYFYGARPGLPTGSMRPGGLGGFGPTGQFMQSRMGYLPLAGTQTQMLTQQSPVGQNLQVPKPNESVSLQPSAHPVYFAGATTFGPTASASFPRSGAYGNSPPAKYTPPARRR